MRHGEKVNLKMNHQGQQKQKQKYYGDDPPPIFLLPDEFHHLPIF